MSYFYLFWKNSYINLCCEYYTDNMQQYYSTRSPANRDKIFSRCNTWDKPESPRTYTYRLKCKASCLIFSVNKTENKWINEIAKILQSHKQLQDLIICIIFKLNFVLCSSKWHLKFDMKKLHQNVVTTTWTEPHQCWDHFLTCKKTVSLKQCC